MRVINCYLMEKDIEKLILDYSLLIVCVQAGFCQIQSLMAKLKL